MNAPWPPYPPQAPPPPGISINGPGIHIHTTGPVVGHGYPQQYHPEVSHPRVSDRSWAPGLGISGLAVLMFSLMGWAVIGLPFVFLIGPAFAGIGMLIGAGYFALANRRPQQALDTGIERRLLVLAKQKGGVVTVSDAALHLQVSLAQAEEALGELLHSGHVDVDNDPDTGAVIYVFRDWAPALPAARR